MAGCTVSVWSALFLFFRSFATGTRQGDAFALACEDEGLKASFDLYASIAQLVRAPDC